MRLDHLLKGDTVLIYPYSQLWEKNTSHSLNEVRAYLKMLTYGMTCYYNYLLLGRREHMYIHGKYKEEVKEQSPICF